jgi:hypothetical protein
MSKVGNGGVLRVSYCFFHVSSFEFCVICLSGSHRGFSKKIKKGSNLVRFSGERRNPRSVNGVRERALLEESRTPDMESNISRYFRAFFAL